MMLTEREVSEIMIEHIMTIEISRNLENSGFRSGSSEERPRDTGRFRSSDSRNDDDRNYGNQKSTTI